MELGLPSSFEHKKEKPNLRENAPKILWERISEKALEIVSRERDLENNPEMRRRVEEILTEPNFRKKNEDIWQEQALRGKVAANPEAQDDLWINGLAIRLKEMIDN